MRYRDVQTSETCKGTGMTGLERHEQSLLKDEGVDGEVE
jgi:hypothetical protein